MKFTINVNNELKKLKYSLFHNSNFEKYPPAPFKGGVAPDYSPFGRGMSKGAEASKKVIQFCLTSLLLTIILFGTFSCIDPYDPQLIGEKKRLVFEGSITNQEGPYDFQLSYTAGYNSKESVYDSYVLGAKMWITDEKNVKTDFIDLNFGNFRTPDNFRGQVGKSYQLHIQLADGRLYESKLETMKPVSAVDKVYSEFKLNTELRPQYRGYFSVYVDTKDPATEGDYYRWIWKHYEKLNSCATWTQPGTDPPAKWFKKCCSDCWKIDRCFGCVTVASDNFINGKTLARQKVAEIPYDSEKPYYMVIEQMSLSREAYNFWKTIDEQANNSGGVFDVAPATLRGNIVNIKDENDPAVGYFQVSAVSQKVVFLQRDRAGVPPFVNFELSYPFWSECQPCNESPFRTGKRPPEWVDLK